MNILCYQLSIAEGLNAIWQLLSQTEILMCGLEN